ncbi:hypothetical protein [Pseudomonas sp. EL_65y_Pfl1_R32]|uniref:hypothetical protein n=1 Tax=Pseudomonas sp. EL_65y_Pfl1_R32 TaxID=3088696 RepID=UPI0030D962DB
MPSPEYSLTDTLERIYENQLALEAAIMELSMWAEQQGGAHVDQNVRGALETIGENQSEIAKRWQRSTPWAWQRKHLGWFLEHFLTGRSKATQYYYLLTIQLLARRLERPWVFKR